MTTYCKSFLHVKLKRLCFPWMPISRLIRMDIIPDSFNKSWQVVGVDIIHFCLSCLRSGHFPTSLNATTVVLIPKIKTPKRAMDYRSISLCNVVYKCISKVLTNRLKRVLPAIISKSQSIFILDRLIADNVMIPHEVCHFLRRKTKGGSGSWFLVYLG